MNNMDLNEFQPTCESKSQHDVAVQSINMEHNIAAPGSRIHTSKNNKIA